ncbi:MAG: hypothetical protein ACJ8AI_06225 [Rhodopila sp.]
MTAETRFFANQTDDAVLIELCQECLRHDRLMATCDEFPGELDEQLAAEITARWWRLLAAIADIPAHTDTARNLKLHISLVASGRVRQRRRVEDETLLSIVKNACPEQLGELSVVADDASGLRQATLSWCEHFSRDVAVRAVLDRRLS